MTAAVASSSLAVASGFDGFRRSPSSNTEQETMSGSMSTRKLQELYRQSQGATAFYAQALPPPQPWVQSGHASRGRSSRVNSWSSELSRSEILEEGGQANNRPVPSRQASTHSVQSRVSYTNGTLHSD